MLNSLRVWVLAGVILVYAVIILGAYTRLKDAGLGCPDWPGCYGALLAPTTTTTLSALEVAKAWIEMIHRYVAGALGILIVIITYKTIQLRRSNPKLCYLASIILGLVIFQALLGMWTVTLRLYPLVVMGHLLGGFAILALLWLLYLNLTPPTAIEPISPTIKSIAYIGGVMLLIQIALGGWTSANYAALVCSDFPSCQGSLWPPLDWRNAFNPNITLENAARVTIQMSHRFGALFTAIVSVILSYCLYATKSQKLQRYALWLITLLSVQLALGISNVLGGLPLVISLMHNAIAALLLLLMISIFYNVNARQRCQQT